MAEARGKRVQAMPDLMLDSERAVAEGIIDSVGTVSDAIEALYEMMV